MIAISTIVAFVLGTAIGSFCNVVIYRLHAGESPFRGRSHCPHCGHELGVADLVPVASFAALGGKCRYCRRQIFWQYPIVELAMGLLAVLMVWAFGVTWTGLLAVVLSAFLLVIFVYDLKHQLILDRVSLPAMAVGLLFSLVVGRSWLSIGLGAVIGAGFFALQYALSRGRWIGGGDIRLGGVLGLSLGWPLVAVCLVLAYFSGSVVAAVLLLTKRKGWSSLLPFGTFLSLAGVVTLVWGQNILQWYLRGGFFDWVVQTLLRFYNPVA